MFTVTNLNFKFQEFKKNSSISHVLDDFEYTRTQFYEYVSDLANV